VSKTIKAIRYEFEFVSFFILYLLSTYEIETG
jgi:hypothetical protein